MEYIKFTSVVQYDGKNMAHIQSNLQPLKRAVRLVLTR